MNKYYLIFAFIILSGCGLSAKYEDVSEEPKYAHFIGTKYQTLETLLVHGVNLGESKEKKIDVYTVTRKPGSGGRYVITRIDLAIGNQIEILGVLRCTNCANNRVLFLIDILSSKDLKPEIPIRLVDLSFIDASSHLTLNPDLFQEVK